MKLTKLQREQLKQKYGGHCVISAEPPFKDCLITVEGAGA